MAWSPPIGIGSSIIVIGPDGLELGSAGLGLGLGGGDFFPLCRRGECDGVNLSSRFYLFVLAGLLAWSPSTCTGSSIIIGPGGSELGFVGLDGAYFFPLCRRDECN